MMGMAILQTGLVTAGDINGVKIEEVVTLSPQGPKLKLKGAAVQRRAQQAIYVGGLYLQNDAKNAEEILADAQAKRFVLYCEQSTIKPDALIRAFNLGITVNHSEEELRSLKPMLAQFNKLWQSEIIEGDEVWIDYIPEKGTVVTINGEQKGVIPGLKFYRAFLKTWLGDKPLNPQMKKQLLGID